MIPAESLRPFVASRSRIARREMSGSAQCIRANVFLLESSQAQLLLLSSKPFQLARAAFAFAPFSSCIFFNSRQRRYCSALAGPESSSPLSQKQNQSTSPCCAIFLSHGLNHEMVVSLLVPIQCP